MFLNHNNISVAIALTSLFLEKTLLLLKKPRTIEGVPKEINNENTNGKVKPEFTFTGEFENVTNDLDNEFKSQFTISEQNSSTERVPLRSISNENVRKRIFKNTANSTLKTKAIVNELNNSNDNTEQYKEERIQSKENNEPNIDSNNTKCGLVFKKSFTESGTWLQQVKSLEKELEQERYSKRELEHEIYMLRQQMEELQNANLQLEKKLMNEEQKNLSLQFYIQNYTKGG